MRNRIAAVVALLAAATAARSEELPVPTNLQPYLHLDQVPVEPALEPEDLKLPPPPPKIWFAEAELGLTGTEGNSRNFKIRLGGKVKRKTEHLILTLDAIYRLANLSGQRSENRLFATDKEEMPFPNTPWSAFISGTTEYDQFKAFDVRLARHGGMSYDFVKDDTITLSGRLGLGGSKEIGGPQNNIVPEAIIGGDFECKISERQKLTATVDVFPDVSDPSDYRAQAKISWEMLIDPEMGLTLRLGVLDLFDSTPENNRKRNDIDYFATLLWKF